MRYGSVCSGIEAASVAWHDLGWQPQWFSEIEQFPSEVLKYRFPHVPNLGDMTTINQNPIADERPIDLLVGGTPCQSFSVAGLRKGLADPRGNLMLTFLSIADKFKPKWVVWENVPGVLSSNGGKDFGTFLGALGELGYGFAYRVLDAQHFGVAQRRRRVFVVGYLGDWRVAAAVLFERESLQGNTKPSRKKREEVTANAEGSVGATSFAGNQQSEIAATLQTTCDDYSRADGFNVIIDRAAFNQGENAQYEPRIEEGETMSSLVAKGPHAVAQPIAYSFDALSSNSMKSSNPNSGCRAVDVAKTLDTTTPEPSKNQGGIAIAQPIAFKEPCPTLTAKMQGSSGWAPYNETDHLVGQPIAVDTYNYTTNDHTTQTIRSQSDTEHIGAVLQPMAFDWQSGGDMRGMNLQEKTQLQRCQTPAVMHSIDFRKSFYEIKKDVLVRKYPVDTDSLKRCLKKHKNISNNKISELLNLPKTKIEHWFRQDDSFAIPSAEHWFQLKEILHIETNIFDQSITEFIIEENKYDSTNRIYDSTFPSPTLTASNSGSDNYVTPMAIRRLTPKECERLQGFPDDWTKIPYRNKEADQCPDGPRYKACGNSMAVPVMRWIGERIQKIENLLNE
jgi:DNA-cytosine methyltransferase